MLFRIASVSIFQFEMYSWSDRIAQRSLSSRRPFSCSLCRVGKSHHGLTPLVVLNRANAVFKWGNVLKLRAVKATLSSISQMHNSLVNLTNAPYNCEGKDLVVMHGHTFRSRERSPAASVGSESDTVLVGRSDHST